MQEMHPSASTDRKSNLIVVTPDDEKRKSDVFSTTAASDNGYIATAMHPPPLQATRDPKRHKCSRCWIDTCVVVAMKKNKSEIEYNHHTMVLSERVRVHAAVWQRKETTSTTTAVTHLDHDLRVVVVEVLELFDHLLAPHARDGKHAHVVGHAALLPCIFVFFRVVPSLFSAAGGGGKQNNSITE